MTSGGRGKVRGILFYAMATVRDLITKYSTKSRFKKAVEDERALRKEKKIHSGTLLKELMRARFHDGPELELYTILDEILFLDVILDVFSDARDIEWDRIWMTRPMEERHDWYMSATATIYLFHRMRDAWKSLYFLSFVEGLAAMWGPVIQPTSPEFRRLRSLLPHQFPTEERYFFLKDVMEQTQHFLDSEEGMVCYFLSHTDHHTDCPFVIDALFQHFEEKVTPKILSMALYAHGVLMDIEIPQHFDKKITLVPMGCERTWKYLEDVPDSEDVIRMLARLLDDEALKRWVDYVTNDPPLRIHEEQHGRTASEGREATVEAVRQSFTRQ